MAEVLLSLLVWLDTAGFEFRSRFPGNLVGTGFGKVAGVWTSCLIGQVALGGDLVKKVIIDRIFQSFEELDRALKTARKSLESKPEMSQDVLVRLDYYDEILEKQRSLATALCGHASLGRWEEVVRHVRLINALSAMIRDDARQLAAGSPIRIAPIDQELMLC